MSKSIKRNRPGRPEGKVDNASERILDAAEYEFSQKGYSETSLRVIAQQAGVTQALLSYYFGSKQGLYESVFMRRSQTIVQERELGLAELFATTEKPKVEDVVRAFLRPTLALRETEAGRRFLHLQARLHTEPLEVSYKLRKAAYTQSTKKYIDAFAKVCPELSAKDVHWKMILMIGAYLYAFSDNHRLDDLAPNICDFKNTHEILEQITKFVSAGIQAK